MEPKADKFPYGGDATIAVPDRVSLVDSPDPVLNSVPEGRVKVTRLPLAVFVPTLEPETVVFGYSGDAVTSDRVRPEDGAKVPVPNPVPDFPSPLVA